ncbi:MULTISPECIES: O-methyltransferase [unclassified Acinetobacter]|uniref:O-methyltransferase n=1 Tax=unclassified Acinetobacter TaxID=196816 RepID=UPI0035B9228A
MSEQATQDLQPLWTAVDDFFEQSLQLNDSTLQQTLDYTEQQGLPSHLHVANNQGKLLAMLLQISQSKRILELGTFAGYSSIYMAQHLPQDAYILTIEGRPGHAEIAKENIRRAGFSEQIDVRVGAAAQVLLDLPEDTAAFDFVFIDADKQSYPQYLELCLKFSRSGTILLFDNVVRAGELVNLDNTKPTMTGLRELMPMLGQHPSLASCTALQTVGSKGYDGFAMAIVK